MTKTILTKEGLEALKKELHELKTVKRKDIAERLKRALEQGDLAENAEYAEVKEEQGFMEGRIAELEAKIKTVQIIEGPRGEIKAVDIGTTVKVKFDSREMSYTIVGTSESDPIHGRISNESPMGVAFLGHKVGDTVSVKTPGGEVEYKILEVK